LLLSGAGDPSANTASTPDAARTPGNRCIYFTSTIEMSYLLRPIDWTNAIFEPSSDHAGVQTFFVDAISCLRPCRSSTASLPSRLRYAIRLPASFGAQPNV